MYCLLLFYVPITKIYYKRMKISLKLPSSFEWFLTPVSRTAVINANSHIVLPAPDRWIHISMHSWPWWQVPPPKANTLLYSGCKNHWKLILTQDAPDLYRYRIPWCLEQEPQYTRVRKNTLHKQILHSLIPGAKTVDNVLNDTVA